MDKYVKVGDSGLKRGIFYGADAAFFGNGRFILLFNRYLDEFFYEQFSWECLLVKRIVFGEPVEDCGQCYDARAGVEELLGQLDEDVGRV